MLSLVTRDVCAWVSGLAPDVSGGAREKGTIERATRSP